MEIRVHGDRNHSSHMRVCHKKIYKTKEFEGTWIKKFWLMSYNIVKGIWTIENRIVQNLFLVKFIYIQHIMHNTRKWWLAKNELEIIEKKIFILNLWHYSRIWLDLMRKASRHPKIVSVKAKFRDGHLSNVSSSTAWASAVWMALWQKNR